MTIATASSVLHRLWEICAATILAVILLLILWIGYHRWLAFRSRQRHRQQKSKSPLVIAFFHPYCSAGGGGERVLWKMVDVLGQLDPDKYPLSIIVYTVDKPTESFQQDLFKLIQDRFSIDPPSARINISFCHLHQHSYLLNQSGFLSLLMESIGTMRLAYRALCQSLQDHVVPHVYVDTTGCAFTYAVAQLVFGCTVMAYVHYPTISTDMIALVYERRRSAYNHQDYISRSRVTTIVKLVYYLGFAVLYGLVGSLARSVLVNSTWTWEHVSSLWWYAAWRKRIRVVYPPCLVGPESEAGALQHRQPVILSIGQFRPEKDHLLQIESLAKLQEQHPKLDVKLVLIGSCRGKGDEDRLAELQRRTRELKLSEYVSFVVNQPYSVIQDWLAKASVGIHTMWNEHFGIGIVEMMAAGLLVVANNSGGPKMDIVVPASTTAASRRPTGFLASTAEEYADALFQALTMPPDEALALRKQAQTRGQLFSDKVFADAFQKEILDLPEFQSAR